MSRFTVIAAVTAAALGTLSIALPAGASVLAPPTPVATTPGCASADNPVVPVVRRKISQDRDCGGQALPAGRRGFNLDECAAGPVVPVGSRHGNLEDCGDAAVPAYKRRIGARDGCAAPVERVGVELVYRKRINHEECAGAGPLVPVGKRLAG